MLIRGALLGLLTATCAQAALRDDIREWSEEGMRFNKSILEMPAAERAPYWQAYEEAMLVQPYNLLAQARGSQELQADLTTRLLIDAVYGAFMGEQTHLKITISQGDAREAAVAQMVKRLPVVARMYPIAEPVSTSEQVSFLQFLLFTYSVAPEQVAQVLESELPRWTGTQRVPALIVLTHHGSAESENELETFPAKQTEQLEVISDVYFETHGKND